tara:strand:- start:224 stop:565 length:342 start_codon:yes stop_codon:yes gene_type:complete
MAKVIKFPKKKQNVDKAKESKRIVSEMLYQLIQVCESEGFDFTDNKIENDLVPVIQQLRALVERQLGADEKWVKAVQELKVRDYWPEEKYEFTLEDDEDGDIFSFEPDDEDDK